MRVLKVEMDRDVLTPLGELDVRNEVSLRREDGEYELETVYDIEAPYRNGNTHKFSMDSVSLGSVEEFDRGYFENFSPGVSAQDHSEDLTVHYLPGRKDGFQRVYNSERVGESYGGNQFLSDLLDLEKDRVFSDVIWRQLDELPVHGQESPISQKEFVEWADQLPRQTYEYILTCFEELPDLFDERVEETRDFDDSLKATFGMVSEKLESEKGYQDAPTGQELYELFKDIRGFKPVSKNEGFGLEYSTELAQDMEEFVKRRRSEIDLEMYDFESNSRSESGGAIPDGSGDFSNVLEEKGVRSVEGIVTTEDNSELEDFLRWGLDAG